MTKSFSISNENKRFFKLLIILCIPIIIQNLITVLVNLIDTIMVSTVGYDAIASIGIANQFYFLMNMVIVGISGGASLFISQFFGKADYDNIKIVTGLSTIIALLASFIFFSIAFFNPRSIIYIFSKDPALVGPSTSYFKVIAFSYPLTCLSMIFSNCSRAIRRPSLGMVASSIALIVNIFLNYGLILGNFGLPRLEVKGAAISTLVARSIEFIIIIFYIYHLADKHPLRFSFKNIRSINLDFLKQFFSKSIPVLINDSLWALGTIAFSIAYSLTGKLSIAIGQIAGTTQNIFLIITLCIAIAGGVLIGNELGAGRIESAIVTAKKLAIVITLVGIIMSLVLVSSTEFLLKIYNVGPDQTLEVTKVFRAMGLILTLKALNTFIIISVLRSGGDTKVATLLETFALWCVAVPLTFYGAHKGYPMHILVFFSLFEEIIKVFLTIPRALTKKWARNIVDDL